MIKRTDVVSIKEFRERKEREENVVMWRRFKEELAVMEMMERRVVVLDEDTGEKV